MAARPTLVRSSSTRPITSIHVTSIPLWARLAPDSSPIAWDRSSAAISCSSGEAPNSFLRDRLHSNALRQLVEARKIGRNRDLQAVGLPFELRFEVLEDRTSVARGFAIACQHDAQE